MPRPLAVAGAESHSCFTLGVAKAASASALKRKARTTFLAIVEYSIPLSEILRLTREIEHLGLAVERSRRLSVWKGRIQTVPSCSVECGPGRRARRPAGIRQTAGTKAPRRPFPLQMEKRPRSQSTPQLSCADPCRSLTYIRIRFPETFPDPMIFPTIVSDTKGNQSSGACQGLSAFQTKERVRGSSGTGGSVWTTR